MFHDFAVTPGVLLSIIFISDI